MSKLYITRGIPGSGKTTWASEKLKEVGLPGAMVTERDMLRQELGFVPLGAKGIGTHEDEKQVSKVQHERVRAALKMGLTVIVSDTNLRDKVLRELIGIAEDEGAEVHVKDFRDVPLDVCKERNNLRGENKVPDHVMDNMHQKFVEGRDLSIIPEAFKLEKTKFDFDSVEKYSAPVLGTPTYLVDVDGSLASHEGIRSPYDVTKYREDLPYEDLIHTVKSLYDSGNKIIVFSGRHKDYKDDLVWWLNNHGVPYDEIVMRERPSVSDDEEKLDMFNRYIRDREDIHVIATFDDRNRVVNNTWRKALGIRCYQVADGDF